MNKIAQCEDWTEECSKNDCTGREEDCKDIMPCWTGTQAGAIRRGIEEFLEELVRRLEELYKKTHTLEEKIRIAKEIIKVRSAKRVLWARCYQIDDYLNDGTIDNDALMPS